MSIGDRCTEYAYGEVANSKHIDFVKGANIARFNKVTDAMLAYGVGPTGAASPAPRRAGRCGIDRQEEIIDIASLN